MLSEAEAAFDRPGRVGITAKGKMTVAAVDKIFRSSFTNALVIPDDTRKMPIVFRPGELKPVLWGCPE